MGTHVCGTPEVTGAADVLGAILRLSPIRRAMASRQMKSVYLERLIARVEH